jgi:hypothetical protein
LRPIHRLCCTIAELVCADGDENICRRDLEDDCVDSTATEDACRLCLAAHCRQIH